MSLLDAIPRMTERAWQGQVLALARLFGYRYWHDDATNVPRTCPHCRKPIKVKRNAPGWPDLFLLRGDTLIVAELKSDRNYPTPEQRAWLDAFRQVRRVMVVVWKPRDTDEVVKLLS